APQRGEVGAEGCRERDPERELSGIGAGDRSGPDQERHLAGDEQQGEAEEDAGAGAIEAAIQNGEGRHREPGEAAYRELPEEQQEKAVAEGRRGGEVW